MNGELKKVRTFTKNLMHEVIEKKYKHAYFGVFLSCQDLDYITLHVHVKICNSNLNSVVKGTCQRSHKSPIELVVNGMFLMHDTYST